MVKWAILYTDWSYFTNEMGEPWEAPRRNVACVAELDDQAGVVIHSSSPGFWSWREGHWWPHNTEWDWIDYVTTLLPHPNAPLRGAYVYGDGQWAAAKKRVLELFDVQKSGRYPHERL